MLSAAGVSVRSIARRRTAPSGAVAPRWLLGMPVVLVVVVSASWLVNLPAGRGAALTALGQLAGLLCSVFALLTVALMARVPVVTDVLGSDRTIVWHRRAATATIAFLAVHVAAVVLGAAVATGSAVGSEIRTMLTDSPDMLTAAAATVLLGIIFVSSIRAIRTRLRHETWAFLHLYVYVAVLLAFGHELSNGSSFVDASWPTLVWTWLHVAVAGLVLWYRVALPLWHAVAHPIEFGAARAAGGGAQNVELVGRHLDAYVPEPGQHLRLRVLDRERWWQSHPFSFSAVPRAHRWRITVAPEGDFTRALGEVPPGTRVLVSGVYGHLRPTTTAAAGVALIAGGSGVAPLRSLLEAFSNRTDVRLLYRVRSDEDVILRKEIERLARAHGHPVDYLVGRRDPDPSRDLLSPTSLAGIVPDIRDRDVIICGHAGFVDAVEASLHELGIPPTSIRAERFDP